MNLIVKSTGQVFEQKDDSDQTYYWFLDHEYVFMVNGEFVARVKDLELFGIEVEKQ